MCACVCVSLQAKNMFLLFPLDISMRDKYEVAIDLVEIIFINRNVSMKKTNKTNEIIRLTIEE